MPMVAHCVHAKDGGEGKFGVLGIFYEVGSTADTFLAQFEDSLPMPPNTPSRRLSGAVATSSFTGPIDLDGIYRGLSLRQYWSYNGSLTTPPCSEVVDWHILMGRKKVTQEQLEKFRAAVGWASVGGNFRSPQPLNGRRIAGCAGSTYIEFVDAAHGRRVSLAVLVSWALTLAAAWGPH